MIKAILTAAAFILCVNAAQAAGNDDENWFWDNAITELTFDYGSEHKGLHPMSVGMNIGFKLTSFVYAYFSYQVLTGLYKNEDERTFCESECNIGGGLGITVYEVLGRNGIGSIDIRGRITTSVGDAEWRNTTTTAGLYYRYKPECSILAPFVGIGYQHVNSYSSAVGSYDGAFISVGIGF